MSRRRSATRKETPANNNANDWAVRAGGDRLSSTPAPSYLPFRSAESLPRTSFLPVPGLPVKRMKRGEKKDRARHRNSHPGYPAPPKTLQRAIAPWPLTRFPGCALLAYTKEITRISISRRVRQWPRPRSRFRALLLDPPCVLLHGARARTLKAASQVYGCCANARSPIDRIIDNAAQTRGKIFVRLTIGSLADGGAYSYKLTDA